MRKVVVIAATHAEAVAHGGADGLRIDAFTPVSASDKRVMERLLEVEGSLFTFAPEWKRLVTSDRAVDIEMFVESRHRRAA